MGCICPISQKEEMEAPIHKQVTRSHRASEDGVRESGLTLGCPNFTPGSPQHCAPPSTHLAALVAKIILFAGLAAVLLQLGAVGLGRHDAPCVQVGTELGRQGEKGSLKW